MSSSPAPVIRPKAEPRAAGRDASTAPAAAAGTSASTPRERNPTAAAAPTIAHTQNHRQGKMHWDVHTSIAHGPSLWQPVT